MKPIIKQTICCFICIIIYNQSVIAQDLKELSKQDTIYYYFKHKKNETVRGLKVYTPPDLLNMKYYVRLRKINQIFYFTYYKHWKGYKDSIIDIPPIPKNRLFLKKNKRKILTYSKLKKFSLDSLKDFYWKNNRKTIYLIDKKDSKDTEIFLKRVQWSSTFPIEQ